MKKAKGIMQIRKQIIYVNNVSITNK